MDEFEARLRAQRGVKNKRGGSSLERGEQMAVEPNRVANRRRDCEVDLGSKSEVGYQEQCRQAVRGRRVRGSRHLSPTPQTDPATGGPLPLPQVEPGRRHHMLMHNTLID